MESSQMGDLLILQASTPTSHALTPSQTLEEDISPPISTRFQRRSKSVSYQSPPDNIVPIKKKISFLEPVKENIVSPSVSPRNLRRRASIASYTSQIRDFVPPSSGDELIRLIDSNEVSELFDDWVLITRPNGSTLWVNKSTGKFRTYPPNTVYKKLMVDLEEKAQAISVLNAELKDIKGLTGRTMVKLNHKQEVEQDLKKVQQKYEELEAVLIRTNFNLQKAKDEVSLKESLLRQRDLEITKLKNELLKFDEKSEKADSVIESFDSMRHRISQLETSLRAAEFELQKAKQSQNVNTLDIQKANETISDLSHRNENLKYQIRLEIERNAKIGSEIIDLDDLKRENEQIKNELATVKNDLANQTRLLVSARRLTRQQGEEIISIKGERDTLSKSKDDLEMLHQEIQTLKGLLAGKDALVVRHTQTISAMTQLIKRLKDVDPLVRNEIELFLETLKLAEEEKVKGKVEKKRPFSAVVPERQTNSRLLMERPQSVSPALFKEGSPIHSRINGFRSSSSSSFRSSTGRINLSLTRNSQIRSVYGNGTPDSCTSQIPKRDLDTIAALYLHLGDRVQVRVNGCLKSGVIKYLGKLGNKIGDHKVYAGIKMEARVGNCDGSFQGERYFTTSENLAMFVRSSKVVTVFNVKKDSYRKMEECLRDYLHMAGS